LHEGPHASIDMYVDDLLRCVSDLHQLLPRVPFTFLSSTSKEWLCSCLSEIFADVAVFLLLLEVTVVVITVVVAESLNVHC
jgi:hypothetical protein